jgi:hypothetical protein
MLDEQDGTRSFTWWKEGNVPLNRNDDNELRMSNEPFPGQVFESMGTNIETPAHLTNESG